MSSNFLITSIDPTNKKPKNKIDIDLKIVEKILKKQQKIEKNNPFEILQDKKNLINLEKKYKDSLILLKILEKKAQQNIFEKYNIKNNSILEKDSKKIINNINDIDNNENNIIQDMLMKKKF